jgi:hypothetical protein
MDVNPWIPIIAGDLFLALCLAIALGVPETRSTKHSTTGLHNDETERVFGAEDPSSKATSTKKSFADQSKEYVRRFTKASRFLWQSKGVMLLLSILLVNALGSGSSQLLVLYATKKFFWTISKVRKQSPFVPFLPSLPVVYLVLEPCI